MSESQPTSIIESIRSLIPVSRSKAEITFDDSADLPVGTVYRMLLNQISANEKSIAILGRIPSSEPTIEGDELVVHRLERSFKIGFIDPRIAPLQWMDVDRHSLDVTARFTVKKTANRTTVTADIQQGWTRFAVWMLIGIPFIGQAYFINLFIRSRLVANPRIRSAIQKLLNTLIEDFRRESLTKKLNTSIERLS